jgi:hypothetical protein
MHSPQAGTTVGAFIPIYRSAKYNGLKNRHTEAFAATESTTGGLDAWRLANEGLFRSAIALYRNPLFWLADVLTTGMAQLC